MEHSNTSGMLTSFPHLTGSEFIEACNHLAKSFQRHRNQQEEWTSTEIIVRHDASHLRISKALPNKGHASSRVAVEIVEDEMEEDDNELLLTPPEPQATIHYDIVLSPTYRVPVLYISISDPRHRFPPTMATLYEHLIPPRFKAQTDAVGVIGGVTITDHPATNSPVFFIHPCQTAEVMEASAGKRRLMADEYLIMWMGALGKCVGLNVPPALVRRVGEVADEGR